MQCNANVNVNVGVNVMQCVAMQPNGMHCIAMLRDANVMYVLWCGAMQRDAM